jgi:hypothetical protein
MLRTICQHQKLLFIQKIVIRLLDPSTQPMVMAAEKQKESPIRERRKLKFGKIWYLATSKKEC